MDINAFNFMDGIDGMSTSGATFFSLTIGGYFFWHGIEPLGSLLIILAVSSFVFFLTGGLLVTSDLYAGTKCSQHFRSATHQCDLPYLSAKKMCQRRLDQFRPSCKQKRQQVFVSCERAYATQKQHCQQNATPHPAVFEPRTSMAFASREQNHERYVQTPDPGLDFEEYWVQQQAQYKELCCCAEGTYEDILLETKA